LGIWPVGHESHSKIQDGWRGSDSLNHFVIELGSVFSKQLQLNNDIDFVADVRKRQISVLNISIRFLRSMIRFWLSTAGQLKFHRIVDLKCLKLLRTKDIVRSKKSHHFQRWV
jgi:hypothetical protein